ncbi:hypothetical protein D3C71_1267840 [compost metagenome]
MVQRTQAQYGVKAAILKIRQIRGVRYPGTHAVIAPGLDTLLNDLHMLGSQIGRNHRVPSIRVIERIDARAGAKIQ